MIYTETKKVNVFATAIQQINANGTTTSLEVKTALQGCGFWAEQATVSQFLAELFNDGFLAREFNGEYFVYGFSLAYELALEIRNFYSEQVSTAQATLLQLS